MINKKYSGLLMVGASCFVLASCLPEDELLLNDRELRNIESQIQLYARSFQQYQNKSLSNLINSTGWQTQALGQGTLPDNLEMGNAEGILASAYCRDSADELGYHITWFESEDSGGHVSLKGLGRNSIGQANQKIKSIIPDAQFRVYDGSDINMEAGSVLSLSAGCGLNIPMNSAIAAVSLPRPNDLLAMDTKAILRTRACAGPNESGGIIESTEIGYVVNGPNDVTYIYNGNDYPSEAAVIGAISAADWAEVSNDCVPVMDSTVLAGLSADVDMINMSALSGMSGDVVSGLGDSLSSINCVYVRKNDRDVNDLDQDGDHDEYIYETEGYELESTDYDTCIQEAELNLTDGSDIRAIESFVTIVPQSLVCPIDTADYTGDGNVVMDDSASFFDGVSSSLDGKTGTISTGTPVGSLDIEKTIRIFISLVDLDGAGLPDYNQDLSSYDVFDASGLLKSTATLTNEICDDPNAAGCKAYSSAKLAGIGGQCNASQTLTFSCEQMYPGLTAIGGNFLSTTATPQAPVFAWQPTTASASVSGDCRSHNGNASNCRQGAMAHALINNNYSEADIVSAAQNTMGHPGRQLFRSGGSLSINGNSASIQYNRSGSTENSAGTEHFHWSRTEVHNFTRVNITPPPVYATSSYNGLAFTRNATLNGWNDADMLVPNNYVGQWTQQNTMSCNFQETQVINVGCPSGHTGSNTRTERRTWTATAPNQTPSWGNWATVGTSNNCVRPSQNGGSHGHVVNSNGTSLTSAQYN